MKQAMFFLILSFFILNGLAQKPVKAKGRVKNEHYKKEMQAMQKAIQKHFFDTVAGYYKEVPQPAAEAKPYAYLWPLCAMMQAANEIEKLNSGSPFFSFVLQQINAYYDKAAPAPGYASYIMSLGGGDRFYDDNQWIGIAAMDAYKRKPNAGYLELAKNIYQYMMTGYDTVLGGGIYWQENKKTSKNTCSNGPAILLALQLHGATKNKAYLDTAILLYQWVNQHLKTPSGLYFDNISVKDKKLDRRIFSYNTGTMLQANIYLYEQTKNKTFLKEAVAIADSSINTFYSAQSFKDNYWFNAVLLRAYQHLLMYNKDITYIKAFKARLDDALMHHRNDKGLMVKGQRTLDLVAQGGMLEILARFAFMESKGQLKSIE